MLLFMALSFPHCLTKAMSSTKHYSSMTDHTQPGASQPVASVRTTQPRGPINAVCVTHRHMIYVFIYATGHVTFCMLYHHHVYFLLSNICIKGRLDLMENFCFLCLS